MEPTQIANLAKQQSIKQLGITHSPQMEYTVRERERERELADNTPKISITKRLCAFNVLTKHFLYKGCTDTSTIHELTPKISITKRLCTFNVLTKHFLYNP